MKILAFLIAAFAAAALQATAHAETAQHKLACPAKAPTEWGLPDAPLSEVQVLATPEHEAIDETATPSLVPEVNAVRDGALQQIWPMNSNGPGWLWFVDCRYRGTKRFLRLDAKDTHRCVRTITHYSKATGESARSTQRLVCD